jgi:hypothetical protein
MAEYQLLVELSAGRKEVQLSFLNGSEWDEGVEFLLNSIALRGKVKIPERAELLTLPMALVSLDAHKGKLIIDTITWDENQTNAIKANRYASALLANLGAEFKLPPLEDTTWLSVGPFELVGESPYYYKGTNHIELRSNGTIIASFECVKRGQYEIILRGYSTPIETDYAMAEIMIDSETAGRKEIASGTSSRFKLSPVVITKGRHKVSVRFTNDAYVERQDRNLFFEDLGFREFVPQENSER